MKTNHWIIISANVALTIICLLGCSAQPMATSQPILLIVSPTPTEAGLSPASTLLASPSPATPTASLTLPVLAGTPVPMPQEPITPDNVDQIRELAIWGKGRIEKLAYSPDGKILAVGTLAGVWLYDADTLTELNFLNVGNALDGMAFTEDGTKLVVDSGASTVSIWDVATASRLSSRRIRDGYQGSGVNSPGGIAFSPDATIMAASLDDKRVGLWADQGETYLHTLTQEKGGVYKLALSPDHKLLAAGSLGNLIQLWDVTTGTPLYTLDRTEFGVGAPVFSPQLSVDGSSQVLLATSGEAIQLWDTQTGTLVKKLDEPNPITVLAFSSDGTLLASCAVDNASNRIVQLWQVSDGSLLQTWQTEHLDFVNNLVFSPDNNFLISGSWDGTVQRWDTHTGTLIDKLTGFGRSAISAGQFMGVPLPAFLSKERVFIANPFNDQIELWDLKTGQIVKSLAGHKSTIIDLALSADNSKLVSTEVWTDTIQIWNPATGQNLGTYKLYLETGQDKALAISPDGYLIASGEWARGRNPGVVFSSKDLARWLYQLPGGNGGFNPAFSSDGEKIASFSGLTTIAVSKAATGELLHTLATGVHNSAVAFSPDSQIVAVGTEEGSVQLWDAATGTLVTTLNSETSSQVASLAYSPDGRILAAGLKDTQMPVGALTPTIWLWDVKTGTLLKTIEGYQANIVSLAFSPDGALLATASLDGTMRLWGTFEIKEQ